MEIIPSIFVTSVKQFMEQTTAVADEVDMVHIDITDGRFVPVTTWADPEYVAKNLTTNCELHLMVNEPTKVIEDWEHVPQVKRVFIPAEGGNSVDEAIKIIHSQGWQAGLVFNPETPFGIEKRLLIKLAAVMFMSVHPGKQGQKLIRDVLKKVMAVKKEYPGLFVELDGGVTEKNIGKIKRAGVDAVCPGSAIFGNRQTPSENVRILKNLCSTS